MMPKKTFQKVNPPSPSIVFWPVGTGDSTTIVVKEHVVLQVDLHHMTCANEEDDPHYPVVDHLVAMLPKVGGQPYLSVFALSHPDQDHCLGFGDLLNQVMIGEIWFTPRVFREYSKDLCDDAKAFRKEAKRRVKKMIEKNGHVSSGDRVRIIGYDKLLQEEGYKGFPNDKLTVPGNPIFDVDGETLKDTFRAFVHAPFKDDSFSERNDTSLGLQITLRSCDRVLQGILLGDLCYPTVKRIFEVSTDADLEWNVFLGPHHCSKSVMYWKDEGEEEESLKQGILDSIQKAASSPGHIVVSCDPIPGSNKPGDNPPHSSAKKRYEEIAPDGFICTQEHPDRDTPKPVVFRLTDEGVVKLQLKKAPSGLASAVASARGTRKTPVERTGFGRVRG